MSDEQDVLTSGWVDPRGAARSETGATAAVLPGRQPAGGAAEELPTAGAAAPEPPRPETTPPAGERVPEPVAERSPDPASTPHPTTPHPTTPLSGRGRPRPRLPRPDPLIRMGPWAPVAGATVGLLLGVVVVLLLAPTVVTFDQRLALVFVVLGLTLLGAGGTLLADEVRLLRRGAQAAEARAASVGVIAGLLNGLTPARLLIAASAFCLLLSAYVTRGR